METKSYVPLHVHTEFSLLDGAIKLKDYLAFAEKEGWPAAAITDHGNVFGAVKFFQLAEKSKVAPILGAEMYFTPDVNAPKNAAEKYYHLTLLVKDATGYQNLCRLMAFAHGKGFYFKPRIDFNILRENEAGLILLSGCLGGYVHSILLEAGLGGAEKVAQQFIDIIGKENFFLEVQPGDFAEQSKLNKAIFELAPRLDIKVVATSDSHYLLPAHHLAHEVMLAVGTKNLLSDKDRFTFGEFKGHLKTTAEMLAAFPDHEEVVWASGEIAKRCQFRFKFGELFFPTYQVPEGFTQANYFRHLCTTGLAKYFSWQLIDPQLEDVYQARLELEMNLIEKMGFVGYFLVVWDFCAWAKNQGIAVGPGRGSAVGSLVSWALGITNLDPIKYNLLFERFLNPERVSMPDMDIDFCVVGREAVINYVKEKYGHDCVCQIITFGTMAAKGVVKDVTRVLGFTFAESQALTDLISDQLKISLAEAIAQEPALEKLLNTNPKIKEAFDICFVLEGVTRHASKHAAGVVISPQPLRNVIPLYIPPKTNELVTQYAMSELEAVGFLKMDFLGLKNLSIIDKTIKSILENHGLSINLDKLPIDDQATFKLLGQGKTAGVFQFEGAGVSEILVRLKPDRFEDLIALNALYRPGPLGSGMVDDFIKGRHGEKAPQYIFEELRPVLEETYGVIVYQEQVMKIAAVVGGYSLGGADILRRAMGKKKPEEMEKQRAIFLQGAQARNFDIEKAGKLFELLAYFAGYGFNKSHSAAYALIAYQTAYLKTHYPKEFLAATLSFETSDPDKLQEHLQKASEVDVKMFPPDINCSKVEFAATQHGVLFGLSGIKNVGHACLEEIIKQRTNGPFTSLFDFCRRINLRTANKRVIESLIYAGAMDGLPGNRAQKIAKLDTIMAIANAEKEQAQTGQIGLFGKAQNTDKTTDNTEPTELSFAELAEMPLSLLLEKEKATLGFYLSTHPLEEFRPLITLLQQSRLLFGDDKAVPPPTITLAIASTKNKNSQCVVGLILNSKIISTKNGKKMAFLTLEDSLRRNVEVIVFTDLYERLDLSEISKECVVVFSSSFDKVGEVFKVKAERIVPCKNFFTTPQVQAKLLLELHKDIDAAGLQKLLQFFLPGSLEVVICLEENGHRIKIACAGKYDLAMQNLDHFIKDSRFHPTLILQ